MGSTCGAGTAYPSRALQFNFGFSGVHVVRSLVFCAMFYRSLFVLLCFSILAIVLLALRFMISNYTFGTFALSNFPFSINFRIQYVRDEYHFFLQKTVNVQCFVDQCQSFSLFSFCPLHCVSFFPLRLLFTPLMSSVFPFDVF